MLTGNPPFTKGSTMQVIMSHCMEPLPPIEKKIPDIPPGVVEFLHKMTAKDRNNRFSTPAEVAQCIEQMSVC
jgi:serine/threonine protein kinase